MTSEVILVTGATGFLGPYLLDEAARHGRALGAARRSGTDLQFDLMDRDATTAAVSRIHPVVAIHAAAWTDVDACEREPDVAEAMHVCATRNLVAGLPDDCLLVYISTDQVYADSPGPHAEAAEAPVNAYGRTKLAGEREARRHPRTLVLRSNLFGPSRTPSRASLSDVIVAKLSLGEPMTLFCDLKFSPLHVGTLAKLVCELALSGTTGVYNLGCRDGVSKRDFALFVAQHLGLDTRSTTDGCSTSLPGRAPRARDLRLNVNRLEARLGRPMPTLGEEIAKL